MRAEREPQAARQAAAQDDAARIVASEPLALRELLVNQAHPGVPLDVHPEEGGSCCRLVPGDQTVREQASGGGKASLLQLCEQRLRILNARVDGGVIAVVGGTDLDVPDLEVQHVALDVAKEARQHAGNEDHRGQAEGHRGDRDQGTAAIPPHVPPGHLQDVHPARSLATWRMARV